MKFLSNAHTHTTLCDGASTVAEQLEAADSVIRRYRNALKELAK